MGLRSAGVAATATVGVIMLGTAGVAQAFDVAPSGCVTRPEAVDSTGQPAAVALFGYDNPNPSAQTIDYGPTNIFLQPPNFRHGQPTTFLPGRQLPAFAVDFDPTQQPELDWVVGSDEATTTALCGGGPGAQSLSLPMLGGGSSTAAVGDPLPVTPGTFNDPVGLVDAVIERCDGDACSPVTPPGDALTSYTVTTNDAGYTLRARAIELTMYGWASALSAPVAISGPATGAAPQNPSADTTATAPEPLREPDIGGSAGVGLPLRTDPGTWAGSPAPDLAIQWQRCDAATCTDIPGATGAGYTPTAADTGDQLRAVVTASAAMSGATFGDSPAVAETAASAPTAPVTAAPAVVSAPVVSGVPDIGATLTLTAPGSFSEAVSETVQWQTCDADGCAGVSGATGSTYVVGAGDAGHALRALVTATSPSGRTSTVSNQIGPAGAVRDGTAPAIVGAPATGGRVWADGGNWIGQPAPALTFQWLRCDTAGGACTDISGATGPGYAPAAPDVGHTLRVAVTAANGFSSATATSPPSAAVSGAPGPAASSVDRRAPVLGHLAARPRSFRLGRGVTTLRTVRGTRPRRGTVIRVRVNGAAWVRVDVTQRRHGRLRTLATLTRVLAPGTHWLSFTGRLGPSWGGALAPGTYRLRVRAYGAGGRGSHPRELRVRVLR